MAKRDSVDKIVQSYFAAVNAVPFTYKGVEYPVKTLVVSPLLLRGFTCPEGCGGCCHHKFSLDYLPTERRPAGLQERGVVINGNIIPVYSDWQEENQLEICKHLNHDNGRCGIHVHNPFSCDFELIRFSHFVEVEKAAVSTRLFGRGHAMMRVDGQRGALCTITAPSPESVADAVRKLDRLRKWMRHFKVPHRLDPIIEWCHSNPTQSLTLHGSAHKQSQSTFF